MLSCEFGAGRSSGGSVCIFEMRITATHPENATRLCKWVLDAIMQEFDDLSGMCAVREFGGNDATLDPCVYLKYQ